MHKNIKRFVLVFTAVAVSLSLAQGGKKRDEIADAKGEITGSTAVLWREPTDIATRNLFYGPGGKEHEPHGPLTFVDEDLEGSNPKFNVRDAGDVKWKVKMGAEARPETVASRLVWAVGYFANEDYFVQDLPVAEMPKLHRGQKEVDPDGAVHDVRLKRRNKGEEKIGEWQWANNPFSGTRELNGLRVMMALINNWDLKDENNAIYVQKDAPGEQIYMVSDLGATFGTNGLDRSHEKSKGNLDSYMHSKWIKAVRADAVDFEVPHRPAVVVAGANPHEFISRLHLEWIGKNIPRTDVRWIAGWLARLSGEQIRDAFRAAGYSPDEVEGFACVVEARIAELNKL